VVQQRDEGMISVLWTDKKPCSWSALDGAVALLDSLFTIVHISSLVGTHHKSLGQNEQQFLC